MTVTQPQFRAAIFDAAQPVPAGLLDGLGQPAGRRFNVYRNNVAVSLTEAMHTAFPIITKLMGPANMDGLAGLFLRAHPPASPLMMHYGEEFPAFLADLPQLAHLGYLPDIARLELAMRRAYHAADATPIDADALAAIPPEDLGDTRFRLAPAVQILQSDWPIHYIWQFNTVSDAPKPRAIAQDVLITRPEFDPVPAPLPPGGAACLLALQGGQRLHAALEQAQAKTDAFDFGPVLGLLLQGGAITQLTMKD